MGYYVIPMLWHWGWEFRQYLRSLVTIISHWSIDILHSLLLHQVKDEEKVWMGYSAGSPGTFSNCNLPAVLGLRYYTTETIK